MAIIGKNLGVDPNKDEQYTPLWVFDRLNTHFDLDVASPGIGIDNVPASTRYTKDMDGLNLGWHGFVWMNPPYSKAKPWVEKFIAHNDGIALLPYSKARWMIDMWNESSAICPLYDIKFSQREGKAKGIFMPTALFGMGSRAKEIIETASINKVR